MTFLTCIPNTRKSYDAFACCVDVSPATVEEREIKCIIDVITLQLYMSAHYAYCGNTTGN